MWEYKIIQCGVPLSVHELNRQGLEGWELCGITKHDGIHYYHFKTLK